MHYICICLNNCHLRSVVIYAVKCTVLTVYNMNIFEFADESNLEYIHSKTIKKLPKMGRVLFQRHMIDK